jgi:hypothetical protein
MVSIKNRLAIIEQQTQSAEGYDNQAVIEVMREKLRLCTNENKNALIRLILSGVN